MKLITQLCLLLSQKPRGNFFLCFEFFPTDSYFKFKSGILMGFLFSAFIFLVHGFTKGHIKAYLP